MNFRTPSDALTTTEVAGGLVRGWVTFVPGSHVAYVL